MSPDRKPKQADREQREILARLTMQLLIRTRTQEAHDKLALLTHAHRHKKSYKPHTHWGMANGDLKTLVDIRKGSFALRKRTGNKRAKFRFIDLFAGIGGFRLAGESAGGISVFSSEIDKHARTAYFLNFGEMPFGDIVQYAEGDKTGWIPDHDVLCGGFPCQAFSISGKRLGFGDPRGTLFGRICQIIVAKKKAGCPPKVVFLENVKNFRGHDDGKTYGTVKLELEKLGYRVTSQVIDSAKLGCHTKRERIYIIGVLESLITRHGENRWNTFVDELAGMSHGRISAPAAPLMEVIDGNLSEAKVAELKVKRVDADLVKRAQAEDEKVVPVMQPKIISRIGLGRQGERVYSIKGTAITFSAYGGGVGARTGAYLIGDVIRKLDPSECAKVMGFIKKSIPKGAKADRTMDTELMVKSGIGRLQLYKQFGNSVAVPVVERIFRTIRAHWIS